VTPQDVPHQAPDTDAVDIEGELLVYDGEVLTLLGGTSALIWQQVDGGRTVGEIADALADRFPDSSEQVRTEVLGFLAQLLDKGLLETRPSVVGPRYVRPDHVGWVRDGDTCLLIDLDTGTRRALTSSGSRIWELALEQGRLEPVLAALRSEYPDAPESLPDEVVGLLDELVEAGLLLRHG